MNSTCCAICWSNLVTFCRQLRQIHSHILKKRQTKNVFFSTNQPEVKPGEEEQAEEVESDLAVVASRAEESPCTPAEVKKPAQNQEAVPEDAPAETQTTGSRPEAVRAHSGRERAAKKTNPACAPKRISVKEEEEEEEEEEDGATPEAPRGFQDDDPSDADYTPSESAAMETRCPSGVYAPKSHDRTHSLQLRSICSMCLQNPRNPPAAHPT